MQRSNRKSGRGYADMTLSESELARFREEGFLFMPGLFAAGEVAPLRREMDRIAGKIERLDASSGDGFRPGETADPGSRADSASGHEPRSPADEAQARLDELKRRLARE